MSGHHPRLAGGGSSPSRDFLASLVVFLVALPLCMGIAIASGATVAAGLVTGIVGGLIVGLISGAPLQVSGPAAGLTVVCAEVIGEHGLAAFGVVVALAGVIQFTAGMFKLGQWFRAVSPAVVHGMLTGIGILIVSSQLHVMVDDRPRSGGLANLRSIPEAIQKGMPLPTLGSREERQTRLKLLQDFGDLHERQAELTAHIGRLDWPHESAAETPEQTAQLQPFVPLQRSVVADFAAVEDEALRISAAGEKGPADAALPATVQRAQRSLAAALYDLETKPIHEAERSQEQATAALASVLGNLKNHDWAAKVGLLTVLVIMLWQWLAPRRLRFIPGPLLAVAAATGLAWLLALPVLYVEVPTRLWDGLTLPALTVFSSVPIFELLKAGLFVALIASAETLLCATAVDRMHSGPRTQYDRELTAQGLGNFICGLVGALPMTGVIVRSAANVHAGATSRLSTILHGLWLVIVVAVCGPLLRLIPTAALAGILVYTGFCLIDWRALARFWREDRTEAAIFLTTIGVIVAEDLLLGVVIGLGLSAAKLLWRFSRLNVAVISPAPASAGQAARTIVRVNGAATFLRLPVLAARLEEIPSEGEVVVDLRRLAYLDDACLELLETWIHDREANGQHIVVDWQRLAASLDGKWWEKQIAAPPPKPQRTKEASAA